jgi:hypothetical protein
MAKRHGAEFWQEHLDAWHQSDLTQKAYCANYCLGEKAFYRWRRKEKEAIAAAKATLTWCQPALAAQPLYQATSCDSTAPAAGASNCRQRMHPGWPTS